MAQMQVTLFQQMQQDLKASPPQMLIQRSSIPISLSSLGHES